MRDDECASILFDISTLKLGQKETKVFITDEKVSSSGNTQVQKEICMIYNVWCFVDTVPLTTGAHKIHSLTLAALLVFRSTKKSNTEG